MNIKKFLLSCIAFSSLSYTQAFGFEIRTYSDVPMYGAPSAASAQAEGFFLNCVTAGEDSIKLLDAKIAEIIKQKQFNAYSDFKNQVSEIAKIQDAYGKLQAYMGLIGLTMARIPGFLNADKDKGGLNSYARTLESNTGLPTDLGIEVLVGLQSAINDFFRGGQSQKA